MSTNLKTGDSVTMHGGVYYGVVDSVDAKDNVVVTYTRVRTFTFKASELTKEKVNNAN